MVKLSTVHIVNFIALFFFLILLKFGLTQEGGENGGEESRKDLKSKGLCLVPVACTVHVANSNGADFWAPAMGSNVSSPAGAPAVTITKQQQLK